MKLRPLRPAPRNRPQPRNRPRYKPIRRPRLVPRQGTWTLTKFRAALLTDENYQAIERLCTNSDEEEAEFKRAKKREEERQLFRVVYGRVFNDLENLQIEVQHAIKSGREYPHRLDELGCDWSRIRKMLANVKDCVANMRRYDLEERP